MGRTAKAPKVVKVAMKVAKAKAKSADVEVVEDAKVAMDPAALTKMQNLLKYRASDKNKSGKGKAEAKAALEVCPPTHEF